MADKTEADNGDGRTKDAACRRMDGTGTEHDREHGPYGHGEGADADREQGDASDQPRGTHRIDQRAGRQLAGQGDEPTGGEDEPNIQLRPGMCRQVDRHKGTEPGLNVGEEEAEPVKAAMTAAHHDVDRCFARACPCR